MAEEIDLSVNIISFRVKIFSMLDLNTHIFFWLEFGSLMGFEIGFGFSSKREEMLVSLCKPEEFCC